MKVDNLPKSPAFFVGRKAELNEISRTYQIVLQEKKPRFILIRGDVGMGKTALAAKALAQIAAHHSAPIVGSGFCFLGSENNGLFPFSQLLDNLLMRSEKAHIYVGNWWDLVKEIAPAWLGMLGAAGNIGKAVVTTLNELKKAQYGGFAQEHAFVQFANILHRLAAKRPVVILLEDIHWADASSLSLLSYLCRSLAEYPILFLCTYRSVAAFEAGENARQFSEIRTNLVRWGAKEIDLREGLRVKDYISRRYPDNDFDSGWLAEIQKITDGHALFIEQLFTLWQERGTIACIQDHTRKLWRLQRDVSNFPLPLALDLVLNERIVQMQDELRGALKIASVEGDDFTAQVVARLGKLDIQKNQDNLEILEHRYNLVRQQTSQMVGSKMLAFYQFSHRFIRDHIYNHMSDELRCELHQQVGECLEALYRDDLGAIAHQLARHFQLACNMEKGIDYALLAAHQDVAHYSWNEAIHWIKLVLHLSAQLPQNMQSIVTQADALQLWGEIAFRTGCADEIKPLLEKLLADDKMREIPPTLHVRLLFSLGYLYFVDNENERAVAIAQQAIVQAEKLQDPVLIYEAKDLFKDVAEDNLAQHSVALRVGDELYLLACQMKRVDLQASALSGLCWTLSDLGYDQDAIQKGKQAIELLAQWEGRDDLFEGRCYRYLGDALRESGRYGDAIVAQKKAIVLYERAGDLLHKHWCNYELAKSLFQAHFFERAIKLYLEFLDEIQKLQAEPNPDYAIWVYTDLAALELERQNTTMALKYLELAQSFIARGDSLQNVFELNYTWVAYYYALEDYDKAQEVLGTVLPMVDKIGSGPAQWMVWTIQGQIYQAQEDFQAAAQWFHDGLALSEKYGADLWVAIICQKLGSLYVQQSEIEIAHQFFTRALSIRRQLRHPWAIDELNRLLNQRQSGEAIVGLRKTYPSRYGSPIISQVHTEIFVKQYFTHCIECSFCGDSCCAYGVDVDIENLKRIGKYADELEAYTKISRKKWFRGNLVADGEYPGGKYDRTSVVEGLCVFMNRNDRGCLLHSFCIEHGLDYHELKPMVSTLFPITYEAGILRASDEVKQNSLICLETGPTLYQGNRKELQYYFGDEFVAELDRIEAQYHLYL